MIVREGLNGQPVAALCPAPQISQAQDDPWRAQFLAQASTAFEGHEQSQREARLARENARLNTRVGALTLERNTSDAVLGSADSRRPWSRRVMPRWGNACAR
jgi:hypothetical protein